MKGQVRKTPTEFLDNELVIASLDGYGRLQTVSEPSGAELTVLEQILEKQQEAGWIPKWAEVITSIPPGGIDVAALVPTPYKCFKVEIAANAPGNGNLVYELAGRPGYLVTWFTGPYGGEFGEISKIDATTSVNLLPMKISAR